MPRHPKITHADYYDVVPPSDNAAGDIWSGLPVHGFIGSGTTRALVITPACDLSNRKVDAITYLPIVSVRQYFGLPAFLPDLFREIEGQLRQLNLAGIVPVAGRFTLPPEEQLTTVIDQLSELSASLASPKEQMAAKRAIAGYTAVRTQYAPGLSAPDIDQVKTVFGKSAFGKLLSDITRNAHRLDLHFLPADMQRPEWSAVPNHSLVLFRYAFSVPVEVLECAQNIQEQNWESCVGRLSASTIGVSAFAATRPMKLARLKPRFLSDLLTRYVAMYVRLGSPDFSADTISTFAAEIEAEQ